MCGIVAYIGHQQAFSIILEGLKRLEYRGYDSAGISILDHGIKTVKKKGNLMISMHTLIFPEMVVWPSYTMVLLKITARLRKP